MSNINFVDFEERTFWALIFVFSCVFMYFLKTSIKKRRAQLRVISFSESSPEPANYLETGIGTIQHHFGCSNLHKHYFRITFDVKV